MNIIPKRTTVSSWMNSVQKEKENADVARELNNPNIIFKNLKAIKRKTHQTPNQTQASRQSINNL